MIISSKKEKCCGCGACAQICPVACIDMKSDAEGFLYPTVDEDRCINCGACKEICPVDKKADGSLAVRKMPHAIGGWHKDPAIRQDSSSGGMFTLLAEAILAEGGTVYGCALDEKQRAVHIRIDDKNELYKLRGSKYTQSIIGDSYKQVKKDIDCGRKVLFVGTPCQTAGLHSYIREEGCNRLYTADFICHGVPSPKVFEDYIRSEEEKHGCRIVSFRFRNKDHGWSQTGLQMGTRADFEDGRHIRKYPAFMDPYMNAFLEDVCLRPSCYECSFKSLSKDYADFTIADFWGVDKIDKDLNDRKGTSLLLIHTEKGQALWEKNNNGFFFKKVDPEAATRRNRPLTHSAVKNPRRDDFFRDYNEKGYDYAKKKYMSAIVWAWHRSEQLIKFALVGCSNTIISLAVYYFTHYFLGIHYLIAYTLGFFVSVCNAFFWNSKYVFKDKQETNQIKAFIKLMTSYGASFLISLVLMGFMVELLNIPSLIAPIIKLMVTIPLNFVLNKVWVFKDKKK